VLDEQSVRGIGPFLAEQGRVTGKPDRLAANGGKSFIGSYVLGMGFVLMPEEAKALIRKDRRNRDVLFMYMNGEDLNSRPDQSASRWVINFKDWPLDRKGIAKSHEGPVAADYPDCLAIIREKVKPERQRKASDGSYKLRKPLPERWWHYAEKRPALYSAIADLTRVIVIARVSNTLAFSFVDRGAVFSDALVVLAMSDTSELAILQSTIHELWAREYASSLRKDVRYTPSDCFETFPFPEKLSLLAGIGRRYAAHRDEVMRTQNVGLTGVYNRFHDPTCEERSIGELRELHMELDQATVRAFEWTDIDLGHGFRSTDLGVRFTATEVAGREVLGRLLELNHARYRAEMVEGRHADARKAGRGKKGRRSMAAEVGGLPDGLEGGG
jgi:hypothetical protein